MESTEGIVVSNPGYVVHGHDHVKVKSKMPEKRFKKTGPSSASVADQSRLLKVSPFLLLFAHFGLFFVDSKRDMGSWDYSKSTGTLTGGDHLRDSDQI